MRQLNVDESVATIIATLQLLDIYIYIYIDYLLFQKLKSLGNNKFNNNSNNI